MDGDVPTGDVIKGAAGVLTPFGAQYDLTKVLLLWVPGRSCSLYFSRAEDLFFRRAFTVARR